MMIHVSKARRFVPIVILVFHSGPALGSQEPNGDRDAVVAALIVYHAALEAGEPDEVVRVLGPSYFMADEKSTGGDERTSAHMFLTGETLAAWPAAFLDEAAPYQNEFDVVSVSIRGDAAAVLTRDTGSNRFRSWRDEELTWFLGRNSGEWRIVGVIIRDIQLPGAPR